MSYIKRSTCGKARLFLVIGIYVLFLAGCVPPMKETVNEIKQSQVGEPFYQQLGSLPLYQSVPVTDRNSGGEVQVTVVQQYLSAAAVPCRIILLVHKNGSKSELTLCQAASGQWFEAPSITSNSSTVHR